MSTPRIIIAGTNSGCGKTTVTLGIMAALARKGLKVQPYKAGPDYIDPMFHTFAAGKYSRNLDSWILDEETLAYLFHKNYRDADIAVIEGVMGFYDGYGVHSILGSTAHISQIIKAPVILVVDGEGMSTSISAIIKGFQVFNIDSNIRGVIINNIKSEGHYNLLKETIEENNNLSVIGYLPKKDDYGLSERHLGLVPSGEVEGIKEKIEILSEEVLKHLDLELLMKIADDAPETKEPSLDLQEIRNLKSGPKTVIAVAWDKAFNFYYRDNLELLEELGAELRYFSPIEDESIPNDIGGLYIGGGYPELWAEQLQENKAMRTGIKDALQRGLPAYAECGGLMYMTDSITDKNENTYEMTGLIRGKSFMTQSLKRFGYVNVDILGGNILTHQDTSVRAHEFHYSESIVHDDISRCYRIYRNRKDNSASWECGYRVYNLVAGYPHIHFWSNIKLAEGFVKSCMEYQKTL